ncbi:hypothetical protein F5Y09DRAFT_298596 [Xylaria sp. FL1042]|nr:hypothetical protein F5Y09DRAFT_298596 [Xylaria sp. FL1042]
MIVYFPTTYLRRTQQSSICPFRLPTHFRDTKLPVMSVVPPTGVLRKLLEEADRDIEYRASAFWQIFLQRAFQDDMNFIVVCEYPPDESRRRVDIVIKHYNADHHNFTAMIYVEVKRKRGSLQTCEEQALDAALKAIDGYGLQAVYAMTTQGLLFRVWIVHHERRVLEPLHGDRRRADRNQYIHVDSDMGEELLEVLALIKSEPPLRRAPILPSQALKQESEDASEEDRSENQQQNDQQQDDQQQDDQQQYSQAMEVESHQAESEPSGQEAPSVQVWTKVDIRTIYHMSRGNEYMFDTGKGKISTGKNDWNSTSYRRKQAWYYYHEGVYYYTREKPGGR